MDLFEYQAKELFAKHQIPIQQGIVATTSEGARAAAAQFGKQVVIKAQVKIGGRGKAGGVKLANTPEEAAEKAGPILGMDIRGHTVHRVLVADALDIAEEYYFSFLVDRANRRYLTIASSEGGVDIEHVAATNPEAVAKVPIDPTPTMEVAAARKLLEQARFPEAVLDQGASLVAKLWGLFVQEDATLVEVNPLVKTVDGRVVALDAKVTLDDNARFRHPDHKDYVDTEAADPFEARAKEKHLNYVKLDGQVGIIGNGAGLVMSTLDVVAYAGEDLGVAPANFLDIGGGASAQVMADGLEIVLSDPSVRCVFVNVFGGITACDEVANGIVSALSLLHERGEDVSRPLVVRLDGNNAAEGRQILAAANHRLIEEVDTMDGAARRAAELAAQGA